MERPFVGPLETLNGPPVENHWSKLIKNCTIAAAISSASNITVVAIDVIYKRKMAQLVSVTLTGRLTSK